MCILRKCIIRCLTLECTDTDDQGLLLRVITVMSCQSTANTTRFDSHTTHYPSGSRSKKYSRPTLYSIRLPKKKRTHSHLIPCPNPPTNPAKIEAESPTLYPHLSHPYNPAYSGAATSQRESSLLDCSTEDYSSHLGPSCIAGYPSEKAE
jgi:hypothetical protein